MRDRYPRRFGGGKKSVLFAITGIPSMPNGASGKYIRGISNRPPVRTIGTAMIVTIIARIFQVFVVGLLRVLISFASMKDVRSIIKNINVASMLVPKRFAVIV